MVLRHRPSFVCAMEATQLTGGTYVHVQVRSTALLLLGRERRVHQSFGLGFLRPVFTTTSPTRNTVTIPPTIRVVHQHC